MAVCKTIEKVAEPNFLNLLILKFFEFSLLLPAAWQI